MQIKYLGHSCFLLTIDGHRVITDPFIRENELAAGIVDVDNLEVDYILLSHGHTDHVKDAEELALRNGAPIISMVEVCEWFADKGCQTHEMNFGGTHLFTFGRVKLVRAVHSSSMPDGSYGGTPAGFLIYTTDKLIYFAGDTALTADMQLIPEYWGAPDVSILPIGDTYTMGYEDAAIAARILKTGQVIACHFNTFPPIRIDEAQVQAHFEAEGLTLTIPTINQELEL